jgi:hypothetical protein
MTLKINYYSQKEYNRILDTHKARDRGLSQSECESLLISAGASYQQAKNGVYVYLHHSGNIASSVRGSMSEYNQLLDKFDAKEKSSGECIQYLESLGYRYGQSKTAVYKYREKHGLIKRYKLQ